METREKGTCVLNAKKPIASHVNFKKNLKPGPYEKLTTLEKVQRPKVSIPLESHALLEG